MSTKSLDQNGTEINIFIYSLRMIAETINCMLIIIHFKKKRIYKMVIITVIFFSFFA